MKGYEKIPNIFRIDTGNTHGWQFRAVIAGEKLTQMFSDSVHGGIEKAHKKCVAYRAEAFSTFEDEMFNDLLIGPLAYQPTSRSTSGIPGLCRTYSSKKDKKHYNWQCNYKDDNGNTKYKTFSIGKYGERQSFLLTIRFRKKQFEKFLPVASGRTRRRIESLSREYGEIIHFVEDLPPHEEEDFFELLIDHSITETEKRNFLKSRIGQNKFRNSVLEYWNHECAVTGARSMLNAGHIKPWRSATNAERLDVYNGIALSPSFDKAFDLGMISFSIEGKIMIANIFADDARKLGIWAESALKKVEPGHVKYLKFHNFHVFGGPGF